jgi:hypothetical protein
MAEGARRRRKRRRPDYKAPPTRRSASESAAAGGTGPTGEVAPREHSRARPSSGGRYARGGERPPAPWGKFPLVELVVLLSIVLVVIGFFMSGLRAATLIAAGITLGALAGLELSIREHFAGYKSHSSVLAGAPAVLVLGFGFFLGVAPIVNLAAGVLVFLVGLYLFREAFKRRSGGIGFR